MSVTVEELEILVKANITDALAGMSKLRDQLKKTLSAQMPNIQSQLKPVKQIIDQYGNAITSSAAKTQTEVQRTGDKVKQTVQANQQAAESAKKTFVEKNKNIRDSAKFAEEAEKSLADAISRVPKSGYSNEASQYIPESVRPDYGEYKPFTGPSAIATEPELKRARAYAESLKAISDAVSNAHRVIDSDVMKANLAQTAQTVSKEIPKVKEKISQVKKHTDQATAATKKYGDAVKSSSKSAVSGFSKIRSMLGRMLLFSVAFRAFSGIANAIRDGFQNIAKGSGAANKTLSSLATSFLYLKNSIAAAFMPALQALAPVITSITDKLASMFNLIGQVTSKIFGGSAQVVQAKKAQVDYAASLSKTGGAAKKAGEEAQKSTLSFDKLNKLDSPQKSEDKGGTPEPGDMFTTESISPQANNIVETWKKAANGFYEYFVKPIQNNLSKFDAPVTEFKALFADIGAQCQMWMQPLSDWFQNDFKNALSVSISSAMTILAGIADSAAMVAQTIWDAWKPIIDWLVYNGLPMLTQIWVELSNTAVVAFEAIKVVFDTLWHGVMEPFYKFISKVIVDILGTFKTLWDQYGATTFDNIREAINSTKDILLNIWNSILKPVFDQLFKTLDELWTNHLQPLVYQIGVFVAKLVNGALEIYNGFIAPLVNWFVKTLGPPIANVLSWIIKVIGETVGNIADAASSIFKALGGVIDFLTGVFTGNWSKAWNGIKEIFSGVFGALYNIAKIPLNLIVGLINGVIWGINQLIGGLNKLHISLPDNPITGEGFSLGFNIPPIPSIPKLAQGGALKKSTLVNVAEYPGAAQNPEIVSPQSIMYDTVVDANGELVSAMSGFVLQIVQAIRDYSGGDIYLDGEKITDNSIQHINNQIRLTKKSPFVPA